ERRCIRATARPSSISPSRGTGLVPVLCSLRSVIIGAHVRTKGGIFSAPELAKAEGADAVQLFASNPRQWRGPNVSDERAAEFRAAWKESGLGPLYLHAPYLVNIASPDPEFHHQSVELAKGWMV